MSKKTVGAAPKRWRDKEDDNLHVADPLSSKNSKNLSEMTPFERHQYFSSLADTIEDDETILRRSHKFIRTGEDDEKASPWEVHLARRYYDRLVKEYVIIDLSRYKDQQYGMRWRTQEEVRSGKGQFICGSRNCNNQHQLGTFEVNFGYIEENEARQALVKVRLCMSCAYLLHYHHLRQFKKDNKERSKSEKKKKKKDKTKEKSSSKGHEDITLDKDVVNEILSLQVKLEPVERGAIQGEEYLPLL